ncbi:2-oxoacid:ferredoxin oxidoreductase subunit gamma [candidate division WOR-3 bacterium]|uniref:2-oxoacid:ferredoxin oxidoreductase subunit gamma n=1 Tax=candidate division WOR-3 bacterium TaxID=2052148 RepID=A0A9D5KAS1_UNCW3|nr:2-oxoacid:ferredoxin oxidoreductase subunit gamma [candidate division WOR-3 bacterium]MBD3365536.1 2-oxoacid:ferredoxin oxidoreductase subunit gamma [candidate division WOR-3 bacterium]
MRTEIRLSGRGGQGLITAGIILAEACGVYESKEVVQTQSYGPEARGGASRAEVVISDNQIRYPRAYNPDILVALSQEAFDRFSPQIKEDGLIFADTFYVETDKKEVISMPFSETARTEIGREVVTNILMLAALSATTRIVKLESLKKAVKHRVRSAFIEMNMKALDVGFKLGEEKWKERSS